MKKCDWREDSVLRNGVLVCPHNTCLMTRHNLDKILQAFSKKK